MSGLARDVAAFKSALHRQDYSSWHSQPPPLQPQSATVTTSSDAAPPTAESSKKKKQPKTNIVYSQPADTSTGSNVNTQLVYLVSHLKSTGNPIRLQDLAILTSTPVDTDPVLLEKFRAHDRVIHDPKTDLYSYRHDYNVRNKAALLTEIQRQTRKGGGLSVRTLKESWKEAPIAIEELEKEGDVYVTRTQKDGQMRMVFWNEMKPNEETGGMAAEQGPGSVLAGDSAVRYADSHAEFLDLWRKLQVPNEVDLLKQLASEGLQATAAEQIVRPNASQKKKGKRSAPRQRQVRITNTHLKGQIDLSRDFVAPGAK